MKISNLDDILAILVHLGYLAFDKKTYVKARAGVTEVKTDGTVKIPNHEIYEQFLSVLKNLGSIESNEFELISAEIVSLTFDGDGEEDLDRLAEDIRRIHNDYVSNEYDYNNEHELSNTVRLAYFNVICDYFSKTEESSGRGRADVVFEPRKGKDVIPMIMEFKVDDTPPRRHIRDKEKRL